MRGKAAGWGACYNRRVEQGFLHALTLPLRELARRFLDWLPGFLAAFVLLFVGLVLARALRTLVERALARAGVDARLGSVGINELLTRMGLGGSPTFAAGFVAYWFVLLAFIVTAANAVDLPVVSQLLERFLNFLPSLVAAILILFGGLLFARFLSRVVANAAQANDLGDGELLAKAAYAIVLCFAGLMALEQLGIQMLLVSASIQIVLASVGLALALAFGLGGRDIAAEYLRELLKKKS